HPDREREEDADFEDAEDHAGVRREANVAVGQDEDRERGDEHPDPPLTGPVPAYVGAEDVGGRPGEDEEEQWRDERLEAEEDHADEEAWHRAERFSDVG